MTKHKSGELMKKHTKKSTVEKHRGFGVYDKAILRLHRAGYFRVTRQGRIINNSTGNVLGTKYRGPKGTTAYVKVSLPVRDTPDRVGRYGEKVPAHRVVALVNYGMPPKGCDRVNHIDGNGLNNHPSNLEWCSAKYNTQQAIALGTFSQNGEENQCALLTDKRVRRILLSSKTEAELAVRYHVGWKTIQGVRLGTSWKHVYDKIKNTKKFKRLRAARALGLKSGPNLTEAQIKRIFKSKDSIEALAIEFHKGCGLISNIKEQRAHASITKGLKRG